MTRRIWIRTDASSVIGMGHVMRCLSIAEAASRHRVEIMFVSSARDGLAERVFERRKFPFTLLDEACSPEWLDEPVPGQDIILFDGYQFGAVDYAAAHKRELRVAAVNDFGTGDFQVDVLIDPNHEDVSGYTVPSSATVLSGPRYALVRQEFSGKRRLRAGGSGRLLILTGSSDAAGILQLILDTLAGVRLFREYVVLLGPGVTSSPQTDFRPISLLRDPANMGALLDTADAAISTAGATAWELLCTGIPSGLIKIAENQARVVSSIAAHEAALVVGEAKDIQEHLLPIMQRLADRECQRELSRRALETVDGRGPERVLRALTGGW